MNFIAPLRTHFQPSFISFVSAITSIVSNSISYLSVAFLIFAYFFLFLLALWLLVSLYCYAIEVIIWFILERNTQRSPESLFEIMIPDPDLRVTLKIAVVETGIWLTRLINKFRGRSQEKQGQTLEDIPVLLPPICYKTGKMKTSWIECAICLDDFVDGELCRAFPVCNHIFHLNCIDQWLRHRLNCPICRNPVIDV